MTAFTVAVSAGHNPDAKGASYKEANEYDEAVLWQDKIIELLGSWDQGSPNIHFIPKRVDTGSLREKVKQINAIKGVDIAIEVHFNAAGDPNISGCETLFYPGSSAGREAGKFVNKEIFSAMQVKNRGVKEGWYKMDRPGVIDFPGDVDGDENPDYFLAKTRCASLILEPDFIAQIENIQARREAACAGICSAMYTLADRKHQLHNLPPEDRPSGIK